MSAEHNVVEWDKAFQDISGNVPLHYTARYLDAHGQIHRLEVWRLGQLHLRRKTDDRIDLHADAVPSASKIAPAAQHLDYVWQIVDLQKRIDHRISTAGMMHLGMLYSYYSMAHVLTRPAGTFTLRRSDDPANSAKESVQSSMAIGSSNLIHEPCTWWQIDAPSQAAMRVCWMGHEGIPERTYRKTSQGWQLDFQIEGLDHHPIAPSIFTVRTDGLQVRNVDEIEEED